MWQKALAWQKGLPNYAFDPAVLAQMEAENKAKIQEYLRTYEAEIKGTKHVRYLPPRRGWRGRKPGKRGSVGKKIAALELCGEDSQGEGPKGPALWGGVPHQ